MLTPPDLSYKRILQHGTEQCIKALESLGRQTGSNLRASLPIAFDLILDHMATTLVRLSHARFLATEQSTKNPWRFYFWPGYDTVLLADEIRRFTLKESFNNSSIDGGRTYCDKCVFEDFKVEQCVNCRRPSLSSVAFSLILKHYSTDQINGFDFVPGSTHAWISKLDAVLQRDESPLYVLAVTRDRLRLRDSETILQIGLANDGRGWGHEMAAVLSDKSIVRGSSWPTPASDVDYQLDAATRQMADEIRLLLYDIWLAATLYVRSGHLSRAVESLDDFVTNAVDSRALTRGSLNNLIKRSLMLLSRQELDQLGVRFDAFRFWYSLGLHPAPAPANTTVRPDLGSAMFLSTYSLSPRYLETARTWIQSIYLLMRSFEVACLSQIKSTRDAFDAFSHEVKKLAEPLNNRWIQPIGNWFDLEDLPAASPCSLGKLGRVQLNPDLNDVADSILVAPVGELVLYLGKALRFWSMSENPKDLPFDLSAINSFGDLTAEAWKLARDVMVVHSLKGDGFQSDLEARQLRTRLSRVTLVFDKQRPVCEDNCDALAFRGAAVLDDGELAWLTRLLAAIFTNCLQHGDPFTPVKVSFVEVTPMTYEMTVVNAPLPPPEKILESLRDYCGFDSETALEVRHRFRYGRSGISSLTKIASTLRTVELCLQELGGGVVNEWPAATPIGIVRTRVTWTLRRHE